MKRIVLIGLMLLAATRAYAWPPSDNPYVDKQAPCFRWPAVDYDGDGVFDRLDRCPDTPKGCTVNASGCQTDADGDGVCDGLDKCPNTPSGTKVDAEGCSDLQRSQMANRSSESHAQAAPPPPPAKPVSEMERKLVETGSYRLENVHFESGSNRLLPESETSLNEAGAVLEKFPNLKIEVEGHTDKRGRADYNMKLSQTRAEIVRQYLLDHFKLRPDNYTARGYGETRPESKEHNEEELLRDRRVVLRVTNPGVLPKGVEVKHE